MVVGQFEVVDVEWNENLGSNQLDWALVDFFGSRFNEKFKTDLFISDKAVMKLKKAVGKTKHVLSANSDSTLYVEELFDDKDFSDKITRSLSIWCLETKVVHWQVGVRGDERGFL